MTEIDKKLSVLSYGANNFSLKGVTDTETQILLGSFLGGYSWVRLGQDGHLEYSPSYKELPNPITDEKMFPFWNKENLLNSSVQLKLFHHVSYLNDYSPYSSPSITIQHLCGYDWSEDSYKIEAEKLKGYGFECLRSKRGVDGKFWESWFLPSVSLAKGKLQKAIKESCKGNQKLKTKVAVNFLRSNISFGTLDVSVQRLAQTTD